MSSSLMQYLNKRKAIILAWCINTLCIVLFFALTLEDKRLYMYPVLISAFILIVTASVDFINFKSFQSDFVESVNNSLYQTNSKNRFDGFVLDSVNKLHSNYINEIAQINELNKVKNIFFSKWVHEMKTPLTVIGLIIDRLKFHNEISPELFDLSLEKDKLVKYVDDSLNFIRLDEFSADYKPQKVDLNNLVKESINENKVSFIYNKVYPKIEANCDNVNVLTDYKWCKFIINQLMFNAIKYTAFATNSNKNIVFKIHLNDSKPILSIIDTGVGIAKHDLQRIFNPFFTGELGKKNKSTGMGLYLCKKISQKLGHEIIVSSEQGKGTEVAIIFN